MSISQKIKRINNKIEYYKAQHNIDTNCNDFCIIIGKTSKYKLATGQDILPEKDSLEKAAALKRFEHSPLGK